MAKRPPSEVRRGPMLTTTAKDAGRKYVEAVVDPALAAARVVSAAFDLTANRDIRSVLGGLPSQHRDVSASHRVITTFVTYRVVIPRAPRAPDQQFGSEGAARPLKRGQALRYPCSARNCR